MTEAQLYTYYGRDIPCDWLVQRFLSAPEFGQHAAPEHTEIWFHSGDIVRRCLSVGSAYDLQVLFVNSTPREIHRGATFIRPPFWVSKDPLTKRKGYSGVKDLEWCQPFMLDMDLKCKCEVPNRVTQVCAECWFNILLPSAVAVQQFFKASKIEPYLFTFSGNKGWHAWCLDYKSFAMDADARQFMFARVKAYCSQKGVMSDFDDAVSVGEKPHSLRMPFSPNPKTGYIDAPFDPASKPTLEDVCITVTDSERVNAAVNVAKYFV